MTTYFQFDPRWEWLCFEGRSSYQGTIVSSGEQKKRIKYGRACPRGRYGPARIAQVLGALLGTDCQALNPDFADRVSLSIDAAFLLCGGRLWKITPEPVENRPVGLLYDLHCPDKMRGAAQKKQQFSKLFSANRQGGKTLRSITRTPHATQPHRFIRS